MIPERQLLSMYSELEKIGGGGIMKALTTNITPGTGPLRKRLVRGFKDVGGVLKNQVQRHGIGGLF